MAGFHSLPILAPLAFVAGALAAPALLDAGRLNSNSLATAGGGGGGGAAGSAGGG